MQETLDLINAQGIRHGVPRQFLSNRGSSRAGMLDYIVGSRQWSTHGSIQLLQWHAPGCCRGLRLLPGIAGTQERISPSPPRVTPWFSACQRQLLPPTRGLQIVMAGIATVFREFRPDSGLRRGLSGTTLKQAQRCFGGRQLADQPELRLANRWGFLPVRWSRKTLGPEISTIQVVTPVGGHIRMISRKLERQTGMPGCDQIVIHITSWSANMTLHTRPRPDNKVEPQIAKAQLLLLKRCERTPTGFRVRL